MGQPVRLFVRAPDPAVQGDPFEVIGGIGAADYSDKMLFGCAKGSRRNKVTILEVEAPGGQDAEAQEYQAYSELPQRSPTGWIDIQNVKLFLSEP
jgi:hypothetical protein